MHINKTQSIIKFDSHAFSKAQHKIWIEVYSKIKLKSTIQIDNKIVQKVRNQVRNPISSITYTEITSKFTNQ